MKRTTFLIVLFFLLHPGITFSQYRGNTWVFGDSIGLQFLPSGLGFVKQSSVFTMEACASISTPSGQFQFYAGGFTGNVLPGTSYSVKVWDRLNQVMFNGDSIHGSTTITQGCIIIPFPNDSNLYNLFTISDSTCTCHKLYRCVIDMSLNGGLGKVVLKNELICDSLISEKMTAVKHANGRDWWLLIHSYGTNEFYKYFIGVNGIIGPFIDSIGPTFTTGDVESGEMIFSPNGSKLAMARFTGELVLFDFDRCNGNISNDVYINQVSSSFGDGFYGCSFSPNGNLLYASKYCDSIFQYDLAAANISASKINIYSSPFIGCFEGFGLHQLAPDGKIYIAPTIGLDSLLDYVSVVDSPNVVGGASAFRKYGYYLGESKSLGSLPNMPNYNLGALTGSPCDTLTGIKEIADINNVTLHPNPACNKVQITSKQKINFYTLTTAAGALVQEQKIKQQNSFEINVKELSSGVYFLKLQSDKGFVVRKVVKE